MRHLLETASDLCSFVREHALAITFLLAVAAIPVAVLFNVSQSI